VSESPASAFEEPVRILSDLHLAHPASQIDRVESLRPLIGGARTVIFNGDTCEQSCVDWTEEGEARLGELLELCSQEGAAPVFLAGNHDPEITARGWLDLAGGKILVTHGHAIYPGVAPWTHEYLFRKKEILRMVEERRCAEADLAYHWETTRTITQVLKPERARNLGRMGRNYLLSAAWPPERCFNILRVWLTMVDMANQFVQRFRPKTEVFFFGHFHRAGIWQRDDRIICNTGAFMRGARPLVGDLSDGWLRMFSVDKANGEYHLDGAQTTILVA
jgi:predicted phosphodiesterase